MAYDEGIVARVRAILAVHANLAERRMMGGTCFMVNGHMCCGVSNDRLMVRVGRDAYAATLLDHHVTPLTFAGRSPIGYVLIDRPGFQADADLRSWLRRGLAAVAALPPK
jgi:TfoX/Sxy family transcriptional regulator of competence genes